MDYTFQASPLSVALQLSPVNIVQGTLFASDGLSLSIGLGSVTLRLNRAFTVAPLALPPTLPAIGFRQGAYIWTVAAQEYRLRLSRANLSYATYYEIPQVNPATIEFSPPAHPISEARTQSGTVKQRIWASRPGGGSLKLGFVNISDADTEGLARIWDQAKGRTLSVVLPSRLFRGMSPSLRAHLELNGLPLTWGFSRQPVPRSVFPGRSSIDLEFIARGYGGKALPVVTTPDPPRELFIDPLALSPVLSGAEMRARRIARVASLVVSPELPGATVLRARSAVVSSLSLTLALSDVGVVKGRFVIVESLSLPLSLSDAGMNFVGVRAFRSSPLALTLGLQSVNVFKVAAGDPNFSNVTWLVPMSGVAGGTSFVDRSSFNRTNTTSGNTVYSIAQTRNGEATARFDGASDWIGTTPTADLQLTGDFTIECWAYPTGTGDYIIASSSSDSNTQIFRLNEGGAGRLSFYLNGTQVFAAQAAGVVANQWQHFAISRSGSNTRMFRNGVQVGATNTTWTGTFRCDRIGMFFVSGSPSGNSYLGHLNDFRVTKGVSRYNANFTPEATPLRFPLRTYGDFTVASQNLPATLTSTVFLAPSRFEPVDPLFDNVTLLLPFDFHAADMSRYSRQIGTLSLSNSASVTPARSRFGGASLALTAASFQFASTSGRSNWNFGAADFTIEAWVFQTSRSGNQAIITQWTATATTANWRLIVLSTGEVSFNYVYGTSSVGGVNGPVLPLNQWCHVQVSSVSGVMRVGVNGVSGDPHTALGAIKSVSSTLNIGQNGEGFTWFWNGNIDSIRITTGVSRYDGPTYSVPTSDFPVKGPNADPAGELTVLHLPMNGANNSTVITDLAVVPNTTFAVAGSARISTAASKFNGSSLLVNTGGSYVSGNYHAPHYDLSSIDFTVEGWWYTNTTGGGALLSTRSGGFSDRDWSIQLSTSEARVRANVGGTWSDSFMVVSGLSLSIQTWYHVAWVRRGAEFSLYVDGIRRATVTNTGSLTTTSANPMLIGVSLGSGEAALNGYIDDVRITQGLARYTGTTLTIPSGPFPVSRDATTDPLRSFLSLHVSGLGGNGSTQIIDHSPNAIALTAVGNARIDSAAARFRPTSLFTDGSGDSVTSAANSALAFGTGDFTIQFWVNVNAAGSQSFGRLLQSGDYSAPELNWALCRNASSNPYALQLQTYQNATALDTISIGNLTDNTWVFVAVTRWNGVLNCYLNTSRVTSVANTRNFAGDRISIGGNLTAGEASRSYFQDIKIYKGIALYTRSTLIVPFRPEPLS